MIEKPYKLVNAHLCASSNPFPLSESPLEPVTGLGGVRYHLLTAENATGEDRTARRGDAPDGPDRSGELPPMSNRGVKSSTPGPQGHKEGQFEDLMEEFRVQPGKFNKADVVWLNRARHEANPRAAFIDWLNFSFGEEYYTELKYQDENKRDRYSELAFSYEDIARQLSADLEPILGFGITEAMPGSMFRYAKCFELGKGFGFVGIGGEHQRNTVLVSLTGTGCMAAKDGWEQRMYEFATKLPRGKITRIDLTHDDYEGERYSVDKALEDYHLNGFNQGGRNPEVEQAGNWIKPNGKGRTFYVGARTSGKRLRVYEKGMELGEAWSPWCRVELQLGSKNRFIDWDTLLVPGHYLAGAYRALEWISEERTRIKTKQAVSRTVYNKAIETIRRQFGAYLWVIREIEGSADAALDKLVKEGFPARLDVPDWQRGGVPIHRVSQAQEADPFNVLDGEYALS